MNSLDSDISPLLEALVSHEELNALRDDLLQFAHIQYVQVGGNRNGTVSRTTLSDAVEQLTGGRRARVLIRYDYGGAQWTDTLLATAHGIRLVRIRHEPVQPHIE